MDEINGEHYLKVFSFFFQLMYLMLTFQYYSTIKKIGQDTKNLILPADLDWRRGVNCPNEWIYGEHNTGKSMTARAENKGFYTKMTENILWEGYDNQDIVLIEDIDIYHKSLGHHLKIWADRYAFRGRVLYGSNVMRPKKIVITSQYHPNEIWDDQKTVDAILDRFNLRKLVSLKATDDSIPRKKKPVLVRAKPIRHMNRDSICLKCYMSPCMCDIIAEEPGYLLSQVQITSSEEEEGSEIVID